MWWRYSWEKGRSAVGAARQSNEGNEAMSRNTIVVLVVVVVLVLLGGYSLTG
jgi:cytochrome c-type biogenesis protein CcmH/NrfG